MATATTEMPDGERLVRVGTRIEHLERQVNAIRDDIRVLGSRTDRNFLWTLGILITMWVSLAALFITISFTLPNRLGV